MSTSSASAGSSQTRRSRSVLAVGAAIAGFPIWVAAAITLDIDGHRRDPTGHWDAIVVAGCPVRPDGRPSASLVRRTTKAVELWRQGLAPVIVLTGGVVNWPPAEAVAAAHAARDLGVPESALILESQSTNTAENAQFTRKLALFNAGSSGAKSTSRLIVVTDRYHVRRCEWFFGEYFEVVQGVGVTSPFFGRAKGAFREAIAYAYYWLVRHRPMT
jgi:uncharacterized SAM-binding protein YcdF (DUF218 family)